jgi:uncharacterized protein (TIGR03083 family)
VRGTGTRSAEKVDVVAVLRAQRGATIALLSDLPVDAWDELCLPPWRVRDVVAHLITIDEAAVTGRLLPLLRSARGRDDVENWNDVVITERAAADPATLLDDLDRAGERLASLTMRVPAPIWRLPVRTVFGRHPVAFLPCRRLLDEWVHGVDLARATGREPTTAAGAPALLAGAVLEALPALVLPELPATAGVVRLVVAVGAPGDDGEHVPRRTWAVDFARRQYGPRVTARPDATIRLHATSLALLVEGRAEPDRDPDIRVEGDPGVASALLHGMHATAR